MLDSLNVFGHNFYNSSKKLTKKKKENFSYFEHANAKQLTEEKSDIINPIILEIGQDIHVREVFTIVVVSILHFFAIHLFSIITDYHIFSVPVSKYTNIQIITTLTVKINKNKRISSNKIIIAMKKKNELFY